jgi:hypothetical protein
LLYEVTIIAGMKETRRSSEMNGNNRRRVYDLPTESRS